MIRNAMVLAAGLGTRMKPLTLTKPKALVKVAGKPLVDHVLDRLAQAGVEITVVNIHHHADLLEKHLEGRNQPKIVISDERDALLDSGGGLKKALPLLGKSPFYSINADTIWIEGFKPNLKRLADNFDPDRMDGLLLLASTAASCGYDGRGDFHVDPEGRLERRAERQVTPFVYAGAAVFRPELFTGAPDGPFSLNLLFDRAIQQGRLFGLRLDGLWMHVGTPEAIAEAETCYAESVA